MALRRFAVRSVLGAIGGVSAVGVFLAEPLIDEDPHEALLDVGKRKNKRLHRTKHSFDWQGAQLSYDEYFAKESKRSKGMVVYIAPPSFVASRAMFLDLAESVSENFIVTETPGYGSNGKREIGKSQLNCEMLTDGIETMLEDISKKTGSEGFLTVVASGHASPYLCSIAERRKDLVGQIAILNPTMRGPFPSAQRALENKGNSVAAGIFAAARKLAWVLYQVPLFGPGMHYLANYPSNIEHQLRSHVFIGKSMINADSVKWNQALSRSGTCLPKAAFLVGKTDTPEQTFGDSLFGARDAISACIIGSDTPSNAQTAIPLVRKAGIKVQTTKGMLRSFEEFPDVTAALLRQSLFSDE